MTFIPSFSPSEPNAVKITLAPFNSNNFCGETRANAIRLCDRPCPNGLDSDCAADEKCYLDVLPNECEGKTILVPDLLSMGHCLRIIAPLYLTTTSCWSLIKLHSPASEQPTEYPIGVPVLYPTPSPTTPPRDVAPSKIPTKAPMHSNNFCGETRADAIKLCDKPCSNGLDSECASNEECFINVLASECKGKFEFTSFL